MKKYYHNSIRHINSVTKILIMAFLILAGVYLTQKFFNYWNFQSPITLKFRSPFKRVYLYENSRSIEPLPTSVPRKEGPKSIILPSLTPTPKPKATIQSFPKYLTDNGSANREKILTLASVKYSGDDLIALDNIIKKESGYRPEALNEIGAGGICQAYPYTKMNCPLNQDGLNCQLNWCEKYIESRYGSPSNAWNFHQANNYF